MGPRGAALGGIAVFAARAVVKGSVGEEQDHRQRIGAEARIAEASARAAEARGNEGAEPLARGGLIEAFHLGLGGIPARGGGDRVDGGLHPSHVPVDGEDQAKGDVSSIAAHPGGKVRERRDAQAGVGDRVADAGDDLIAEGASDLIDLRVHRGGDVDQHEDVGAAHHHLGVEG